MIHCLVETISHLDCSLQKGKYKRQGTKVYSVRHTIFLFDTFSFVYVYRFQVIYTLGTTQNYEKMAQFIDTKGGLRFIIATAYRGCSMKVAKSSV